MITNPLRLFKNVPPGGAELYKMQLLEHFYVKPLGKLFDFTITSALRSLSTQANLVDSSGNPVSSSKKAKGISQHCLAESFDVDGNDSNKDIFLYTLENLFPWQIILYYEDGIATSVHISMPSENENIEQKTLLNIDGTYHWFSGEFPEAMRA
jgi:hypothetical protein